MPVTFRGQRVCKLLNNPSSGLITLMINCYSKITRGGRGNGDYFKGKFTYSTDWPINMIVQTKYIPASISRRHLKIKEKKQKQRKSEGKHVMNSPAVQETDQCQCLSIKYLHPCPGSS